MKTFSLMMVIGAAYVIFAEALTQTISHHALNGDDRFAFFVIGMVVAVFAARRLEWID